MFDLLIIGVMVTIAYISGRLIEQSHYKKIKAREKALMHLPYVSDAVTAPQDRIERMRLTSGSCVVAADKFKMILAGLRNLFGGNISSYESVIDRARREAILRMREKAQDADMIIRMRIERSMIKPGCVEVIAYGTAIYLKK